MFLTRNSSMNWYSWDYVSYLLMDCVLWGCIDFNSIEFWGGQNPITMKDGQIDESEFMHEGKMYKVIKSKNNMTVALKDTDVKVDFRYFPEESTWYQMNGNEKVQVVKLKGKKVYTYLPNDKVLVFDENSVNTVEFRSHGSSLRSSEIIYKNGLLAGHFFMPAILSV